MNAIIQSTRSPLGRNNCVPEFLQLEFQQQLNRFYLRRLASPAAFDMVPDAEESARFAMLESHWNQYEEARISLDDLPKTAASFSDWYAGLYRQHRVEVEPFFEYLANGASIEELALYIGMEEQVDGRFDDVIALAQLGMAGDMKLALAENYWDEMGLGRLQEMHTWLFGQSAAYMRRYLPDTNVAAIVPAEAIKNGNLLLMYAMNRRWSARLLGSLAILEHTAPYRFSRTVRGLRRLGVPEHVVYYHDIHIQVDANHGKQLLERVLKPLILDSSAALREVCIGCLIRYTVAIDYYRGLSTMMTQLPQSQISTAPSLDEVI
jgi:Iron-containing redox enzyme